MTVRSYLWGMRLSSLAALVSLGFVVFFIDPFRDGIFGQFLFYVSLFFSVTGLATLFLFWIWRRLRADEAVYQNTGVCFRQGVLVALVVCSLFILQSFRLLLWWDAGLVIAGVLLIELWFLSKS